jgi:ABC-type transport system substrate-binding protein
MKTRWWLAPLILLVTACTKPADPRANTLTVDQGESVKTLDPAQADTAPGSRQVIASLFETLLQYHYLKRPPTVVPLLAEALPVVSEGGLTYTFKLKSGVHFQDSDVFPDGKGRELTATDFIYSWKRAADPRSGGAGWSAFKGRIRGFDRWHERRARNQAEFDEPIEGLQAPDPHTLVIHLIRPFPKLNETLCRTVTAVVPREAVDKYGSEFTDHPVGTGPFRFDSWIRGNEVVLLRNPTWHGEKYPTEGASEDKAEGLLQDAGQPLPFVDRLVFYEVQGDQTRLLNFLRGAFAYLVIPASQIDRVFKDGQFRPYLKGRDLQVLKSSHPVLYHPWLRNLKMDSAVDGFFKYLRLDLARKAKSTTTATTEE